MRPSSNTTVPHSNPAEDQLAEPSPAEATDYIKAMLEYVRDDVRQVFLRVTASLTVAVLVLTQLPFKRLNGLDSVGKGALFVGVAALILAALFAYLYLETIHHARLAIAECLLRSDWKRARESGPTYWKQYDWMLYIGDGMLVLGAAAEAVVVIKLFA